MRDRPGRPPKDTKNTEHILVSREVKEGLEFLRKVYKKDSYGDVVLKLFQQHLISFRSMFFMNEAARIIQKENESNNDAFERLLTYKPIKIELATDQHWIDYKTLSTDEIEGFIRSGIDLDNRIKRYSQTQ
jgi:hypothetical protein